MPVAKAAAAKSTPEECRRIAKQALARHSVLKSPDALCARARLFQALGNETRLKIIALFSTQELCVCDIISAIGGAASTVAHHLRILEDADLVTSRQQGKFTLYTANLALIEKHSVLTSS
ncbi:MAG TPA: metalloregulator ArsR/SmtB family transcription factor [Acidobacteriaceae bacterium]|nr:metalloregulator ArsR/SmtB family transcription factor [Acidobacteriaceae bacterium]